MNRERLMSDYGFQTHIMLANKLTFWLAQTYTMKPYTFVGIFIVVMTLSGCKATERTAEMNAEDMKRAIARRYKEIEFTVGPVSYKLIRIPPGKFDIGSSPTEEGHQPHEGPIRRITISKPFYLGQYEITQAQYKGVMGVNPSRVEGDDLAVDQVSYAQALEFCKKLSQHIGLEVTLPTEAQWEYACRSGTKTQYYSGDTVEDLANVAWYVDNSEGGIHSVGQKQPNAWNLYDMLGNVWELCADLLPPYDQIENKDPVGTISATEGAMRGGGWMHGPEYCRAACRLVSNPRFGGTGMRIAINP